MNGDGWDGKNQLILMHGNGEVLYNAFMHVVIKVEKCRLCRPGGGISCRINR